MTKKKVAKRAQRIFLDDNTLAAKRMQAIEVAARLPEPEPDFGHGLMGGSSPSRPGKSADKVIADAEKIMAFVIRSA